MSVSISSASILSALVVIIKISIGPDFIMDTYNFYEYLDESRVPRPLADIINPMEKYGNAEFIIHV